MEEHMKLNNDDGWPWPNMATANVADALNDMDFEDEVLAIIRKRGGEPVEDATQAYIGRVIEKRVMDEYRRAKADANPVVRMLMLDPRDLDIAYDKLAFWYVYSYELFDDRDYFNAPKRSDNRKPRTPAKKSGRSAPRRY